MGLEIYETKDLFAHLLALTLVVIVTIVQLHYAHKKFKKFIEIPQSQAGIINYSTADQTPEQSEQSVKIEDDSKFKVLVKKTFEKFWSGFEVLLLILEIHFCKILMISLFAWMIVGVHVLNFGFILICIIGVLLRNSIQIFLVKFASILAAILLIANMIYQLQFVQHDNFETNCFVSIPIF